MTATLLEVRSSLRSRLLVGFVAAPALLYTGYRFAANTWGAASSLATVSGILLGSVFALFALAGLWAVTQDPVHFVVTTFGIRGRRLGEEDLPWEAIERVWVRRYFMTPHVCIAVKESHRHRFRPRHPFGPNGKNRKRWGDVAIAWNGFTPKAAAFVRSLPQHLRSAV